uniref:ribonucleoside-diphosphate reductase n=1 Tax=viral metagenome TaxID=1070528 RepID=A0A6C0FBU5_9ZZZZ|tara:strand:+ start:2891 stop:5605 length:2715 start_codon:yes stop_codon:yes gene_type:complete
MDSQTDPKMRVLKRNGEYEEVSFDKIQKRLKQLCIGDEFSQKLTLDETTIAQKVVQEIYDGVKTSELDELSSQIAIAMYSKDPQYKKLAGRIVISNHHKNTKDTFSEKIQNLYDYVHNDMKKPLVADYLYEMVMKHKSEIDSAIDYTLDYKYDFFGFKTLEKNYLYKLDKCIVERPQDMLMRVSLSIYRNSLSDALNNYKMMSQHLFTHATPTLYNAGSRREQYASCFLLPIESDSVVGIYDTLKDCALISKHAGGIGLSIHDIRASNSYIAGTNGYSNGLVPMLRVFNDTARYIDQGGNKRNGSFAIYLEPWHADVMEFLELKKNHGNELERARDLFYALWIPDLFMKRVKGDGMWSLMCPHECPGLADVHSEKFESLYQRYESENRYRKQIKAREIWNAILTSQIETGTPYLLYKDACNQKSNQQNLGTIKSSNLCTEIIEYTSPEETAVCNLASIALKHFVKPSENMKNEFVIYSKPDCVYCDLAKSLCHKLGVSYTTEDYKSLTEISGQFPLGVKFPKIYVTQGQNRTLIGGYTELEEYLRPSFDYSKLKEISGQITRNLNHVIDYNYYPTEKTRRSNMRHRPIGIGVQGLANVFFEMGYAFDSEEARDLNADIFETIYYGALEASMTLAKQREQDMILYKRGMEQHDDTKNTGECVDSHKMHLLQKTLHPIAEEYKDREEYLGTYSSYIGSPMHQGKFQHELWNNSIQPSGMWDWESLRKDVKRYGIRNSLLLAPMPTASTAQILGSYECFEPPQTNVYTRRVLAGEYMVWNDYMIRDLQCLGIWSPTLKDKIIVNDGSLQGIAEIPELIRNRYKTVWEIKQRVLIDMAKERGQYICQSQSLNLFLESPNIQKLTSMHFYAWSQGLKTGIYYLRSRPSSKAIQFSVSAQPESACESCSG